MKHGRIGREPTLTLTIAALILAGATPLLLSQRACGQPAPMVAPERFVPSLGRSTGGGTLELRTEATVYGTEVRLKQVCRWADADGGFFAPIGELVLMRLGERVAFRSISLIELKNRLRDAGVNLAVIRFAGAMACTVARSDAVYDERSAMEQWVQARSAEPRDQAPATRPSAPAVATAPPTPEPTGARSLRQILSEDLAARMGVPVEALQIDFGPRDEKLLVMGEGQFHFQVTPRSAADLGRVAWEVTALRGEDSRTLSIAGTARLWQQQVVVARALAYKQVIRTEDLSERTALVEQRGPVPLLGIEQAIHQQAAMELRPGTVLTARMVDPVPLVRQGQLVTVTIASGGVSITAVGRALEQGAYGQSVRVRNEATKDVYEVVVTGPQAARMGRGQQVASTE